MAIDGMIAAAEESNIMTEHAPSTSRFAALALQLATRCVNACPDRETARARIADNIARVRTAVAGSKAFMRQYSGEDVQLVVLPEYFLTGFPMGDSGPRLAGQGRAGNRWPGIRRAGGHRRRHASFTSPATLTKLIIIFRNSTSSAAS